MSAQGLRNSAAKLTLPRAPSATPNFLGSGPAFFRAVPSVAVACVVTVCVKVVCAWWGRHDTQCHGVGTRCCCWWWQDWQDTVMLVVCTVVLLLQLAGENESTARGVCGDAA